MDEMKTNFRNMGNLIKAGPKGMEIDRGFIYLPTQF
jgi:hypothetical protein